MSTKLLVVDDSAFFRRVVRDILHEEEGIEIIGEASNGSEAIELAGELRPDLVTMDVEMPVTSGVEAVRRIMAQSPTNILMMSSQTRDGAQATLDALAAGAIDFICKEGFVPGRQFTRHLLDKIRGIHRHARPTIGPLCQAMPSRPAQALSETSAWRRGTAAESGFALLAIGASTGGPAALQRLLPALPMDFPMPVVVIQHMPAGFSESFAHRLSCIVPLPVEQARDGESLLPGHIYVAPGGQQLLVDEGALGIHVRLRDAREDEIFHPSIDLALSSMADRVSGRVLAIILTGMGADGCRGGGAIKRRGGVIWAQDEASSVIYGMPRAIVEAGLADAVLSLNELIDKFSMKGQPWIS